MYFYFSWNKSFEMLHRDFRLACGIPNTDSAHSMDCPIVIPLRLSAFLLLSRENNGHYQTRIFIQRGVRKHVHIIYNREMHITHCWRTLTTKFVLPFCFQNIGSVSSFIVLRFKYNWLIGQEMKSSFDRLGTKWISTVSSFFRSNI